MEFSGILEKTNPQSSDVRNSKNIEKKKYSDMTRMEPESGSQVRIRVWWETDSGCGGEWEEETDSAEMNEVIRERREDVELQTSVLITFITLISLMWRCRRFKPGEERDSAGESKSSAPSAAPPAPPPPPHVVAVKVH